MAVINQNTIPSFFVKASGVTVYGQTKEYATYADMLADQNPPLYGLVKDATGDSTVNIGSAAYKYNTLSRVWKKIYEEECMDDEAGGANTAYKGYFSTIAALLSANISGSNGMYAIVGETDSIWIYKESIPGWTNIFPTAVPFTSADITDSVLTIASRFMPKAIRKIKDMELTISGHMIVEDTLSECNATYVIADPTLLGLTRTWSVVVNEKEFAIQYNSDESYWELYNITDSIQISYQSTPNAEPTGGVWTNSAVVTGESAQLIPIIPTSMTNTDSKGIYEFTISIIGPVISGTWFVVF